MSVSFYIFKNKLIIQQLITFALVINLAVTLDPSDHLYMLNIPIICTEKNIYQYKISISIYLVRKFYLSIY